MKMITNHFCNYNALDHLTKCHSMFVINKIKTALSCKQQNVSCIKDKLRVNYTFINNIFWNQSDIPEIPRSVIISPQSQLSQWGRGRGVSLHVSVTLILLPPPPPYIYCRSYSCNCTACRAYSHFK